MEEDGDGADEARGCEGRGWLEVVPGREGGAVRGGTRGETFCKPVGIGQHHIAAVWGGCEFDVRRELLIADETVRPGISEVDFEDVGALLECVFGDGEGPRFAPDGAAGFAIDAEGSRGAVDGAERECGKVEEGRWRGERD